jgi:hypothetical protein
MTVVEDLLDVSEGDRVRVWVDGFDASVVGTVVGVENTLGDTIVDPEHDTLEVTIETDFPSGHFNLDSVVLWVTVKWGYRGDLIVPARVSGFRDGQQVGVGVVREVETVSESAPSL